MSQTPIPVTVLTGFLGAGKTTLLKYLLQAEHGLKLAVIENEFAETEIDSTLLGGAPAEVLTLANGRVCCSMNGDLKRGLMYLYERRESGTIAFDRLVIECTGLADPAPVAQTFFIDEDLCELFVLDGVITLVDAVNAERHLKEPIAQAQVGFADRILLSKTALATVETIDSLTQRLQRINRRATVYTGDHGHIELSRLLDVRGFNLNADFGPALTFRPLSPAHPVDRIRTLVLRTGAALDLDRLSAFMESLLETHGMSLLRYKGVLNIAGEPRRMVFQGVLKLYGFDWDAEWEADAPRESVIVFIGDDLPEDRIRAEFDALAASV